MSQDGRNWARIEADHHTGALFDAGEPQDWDECLNGAPQVVCFKFESAETPLIFNSRGRVQCIDDDIYLHMVTLEPQKVLSPSA